MASSSFVSIMYGSVFQNEISLVATPVSAAPILPPLRAYYLQVLQDVCKDKLLFWKEWQQLSGSEAASMLDEIGFAEIRPMPTGCRDWHLIRAVK